MNSGQITVLLGISQLTIGGAERQLYELGRMLLGSHYRPIVFTLLPDGPYIDLLQKAGVQVFVFPRKHRFDPFPIWQISRLMRREKVMILHTYGFYGSVYGILATLFFRPPLVISSERATRSWVRPLNNPLYFAVQRYLARRTDYLVANAEAVKNFVAAEKGISADKVGVIYNGVDVTRFSNLDREREAILRTTLGIADDEKLVGVIARLDPMKDHVTFLRAVPFILQYAPNTRFLIVGAGRLRDELESLTRQLAIADRVIFTGSQQGDQLIDMMSALDILVSSSKEGEGCSNAILEAMALRKPVVATRIGGSPELVIDGKTGLLVDAQDPIALAEAIRRLLEDDSLRNTLGAAGYQRMLSRFSVQRMVQETVELYESLGKQRLAREYPQV